MTEPLCIGLDAGGSGVRAVLGNADGTILAVGGHRSTRHLVGSVGRRRLVKAWQGVLVPLAAAAASAHGQVVNVHAGLSGISIPGRRETFEAAVRELFPDATCEASTDALVAAWGALVGRAGVIILAGTGSIALAGAGPAYAGRAGGYGYLLGDEGGGFWLAREALAAALRAADGRGPATLLADLICQALGLPDIRGAAGWLYNRRHPVPALGPLAPLVGRAAEQGDAVAADILVTAGSMLANLAASAACQAWPSALPATVPVAQCGRVWQAGGQLQVAFSKRLAQVLPGAHIVPPLLPPVAGAFLLSLQQVDGSAPSPAVISRLEGRFTVGLPSGSGD